MSKETYRKATFWDLVDWKQILPYTLILIIAIFSGLSASNKDVYSEVVELSTIPAYSGEASVVINDNMPIFGEVDSDWSAFEDYEELDELGRCVKATAVISPDLMPTAEREDISSVKPTGWQTTKYDFIDGGNLFNRCHLIAFMLTGENVNEENLITGTRYMNTEGMLPYETMVYDYVMETVEKVLYRVTPIYEGDELIARGVQMEAWSLADNGESICFNVFCYNVQPGVEIDYATGENWESEFTCQHGDQSLVLNTNTGKFHLSTCEGVEDIMSENRQEMSCCPEELIFKGYTPCGSCKPAA